MIEQTFTVTELSKLLRLSRRSLNDPRFRKRIGLRGVRIGDRTLRFFEADVKDTLSPEHSTALRNLDGGTGRDAVQRQIDRGRQLVDERVEKGRA